MASGVATVTANDDAAATATRSNRDLASLALIVDDVATAKAASRALGAADRELLEHLASLLHSTSSRSDGQCLYPFDVREALDAPASLAQRQCAAACLCEVQPFAAADNFDFAKFSKATATKSKIIF